MAIEWQDRETHITRMVVIGQAEVLHGEEKVLLQIKPHQDTFGALSSESEELDLIVQVHIPGAHRLQLERVAALMMDALYE